MIINNIIIHYTHIYIYTYICIHSNPQKDAEDT